MKDSINREADLSELFFEYLCESLRRREEIAHSINKSVRRMRHLIVGCAVLFLAVYFSAPNFQIDLITLGINQKFTLIQLSAIAPLAIAYLVINASILSANHLHFTHECYVIGLELEKIGCPSNYSLLRKYREQTHADEGRFGDVLAVKALSAVYSMRDIFLGFSLLMVVVAAVVIAFDVYSKMISEHPYVGLLLYIYLTLSVVTSLLSVVLFWIAKRRKGQLLETYIKDQLALWVHQ